jgi:uncharacterized protein (DUF1501 family)
MQINRRFFLHKGALAVAGTAAIPGFLVRSVMAEAVGAPGRGSWSSSSAAPPTVSTSSCPTAKRTTTPCGPASPFHRTRFSISTASFGLHPSLAPFKPLYDQGHLAIVHAAGSPDMSRSHFDAQDYMESGHAGREEHQDGWLNRALQAEDLRHRCEGTCEQHTRSAPCPGLRCAAHLAGKIPAIALNNVNGFTVAGRGPSLSPAASAFEAMYADSGDHIFHAAGDETFDAVKMLRAANPAQYTPARRRTIPTEFGNNMKQIAQLLKANLGVEAAFTDVSGWDTHQNQGSVNGQLANRLGDFSASHRRLLARPGR